MNAALFAAAAAASRRFVVHSAAAVPGKDEVFVYW
jgi:hypothetical protein